VDEARASAIDFDDVLAEPCCCPVQGEAGGSSGKFLHRSTSGESPTDNSLHS
jgi:hypothetical protein